MPATPLWKKYIQDKMVFGVLQHTITKGRPDLIIVTGENATGKSLFCRAIGILYKQVDKIESIRFGMETRCTEGMHRIFINAGSESDESTGVNSIHAVLGGCNTSNGRENPHVLIMDEPETGLSPAYTKALGLYIKRFYEQRSKKLKLLMVATHSPSLVEILAPLKPTFIRMGWDQLTMAEFIKGSFLEKGIPDIESLRSKSNELAKKVRGCLKSN